MAFNIYLRSQTGDAWAEVRNTLEEAAAWVATEGTRGRSYLIKKVEEVDVLVLRPDLPWDEGQ